MNTRILYTIMAALLLPLFAGAQSSSSDIITTPGFTYPTNTEYLDYSDSGFVTMTTSNSVAVASFTVRDGGAAGSDADNNPTVIEKIRFRVTNPSFIHKVGIEMNGSIVYQDYTNYKTYFTDTFGIENMSLTVPDDGTVEFKLRVIYSAQVLDNFRNVFKIIEAYPATGSSTFAATDAGGATTPSSGDINKIEVIATRLAFSTQPSPTVYLTTDLDVSPVVSAQDINGRTDFDWEGEIELSNSGNLSMSNYIDTAVFGQVFFEFLQFHQLGTVTLTATTPDNLDDAVSNQLEVLIPPYRKWDGEAGTDNWNDSLNWRPNGVPGALDYVILDNQHITGGYTVYMDQNITKQVKLLTIKPKFGNEIILSIPATNDRPTALSVEGFSGMGDSASVILHAGGIIENNSSDEVSEAFTIRNGEFKIYNDGNYRHHSKTGHSGLVQRLSTDAGTEEGMFRFDVPGITTYDLYVDNANYGSLALFRSDGAATYTGSGSGTLNIRGDLLIIIPTTFEPTVSNIRIGGDLFNSGKFIPSINSWVIMGGSRAQAIAGNGTFQIAKFEIDNSSEAGVSLMRQITMLNIGGSEVKFTDGLLHTTTTNLLRLDEYTIPTGGSIESYISGPVQKKFNDTLDINIPVGKGEYYRPVGLKPVDTNMTTFFIEYNRESPTLAGYDTASRDAVLKKVSSVEYWNISRSNVGTPSDAYVTLGWTQSSGVTPGYENQLRVAYWNGFAWTDLGGGAITGSATIGTVQSDPEATSFGVFTLASLTNLNPLPVELISFSGEFKDGVVELDWITASEINNKGFEIQRSMDGEHWMNIGWKEGHGNYEGELNYDFTDFGLPYAGEPVAYYRLKQIDFNGESAYSNAISVQLQAGDYAISKAYVNQGEQRIYIEMSANESGLMNVSLTDVTGRTIYSGAVMVKPGQNRVSIEVPGLSEGVHILNMDGNGNHLSEKLYTSRR